MPKLPSTVTLIKQKKLIEFKSMIVTATVIIDDVTITLLVVK